jgi:hypothetical protein
MLSIGQVCGAQIAKQVIGIASDSRPVGLGLQPPI